MNLHPFHRVLAGEVVSNFGSMLSRLAIAWLATLALGASPFEMGVLQIPDVAAGAVGALLLGALVDRLGKRAVMQGADLLRAALLARLAALASAQWLALWMQVLAAVASGLLSVAFELARSTWMAHRIAANELPARNAQLAVAAACRKPPRLRSAAGSTKGWRAHHTVSTRRDVRMRSSFVASETLNCRAVATMILSAGSPWKSAPRSPASIAMGSSTSTTLRFGIAAARRMPERPSGARASRPRSTSMAASQQLIAEMTSSSSPDSRRLRRSGNRLWCRVGGRRR